MDQNKVLRHQLGVTSCLFSYVVFERLRAESNGDGGEPSFSPYCSWGECCVDAVPAS